MSEVFKKFITQQDENCISCGKELPKGSYCFTDDEDIVCEDCIEEFNPNGYES